MNAAVIPVLVFVAGMADVSFGTGRMLMIAAGLRWQAALLAMVQVAVFVGAISAVVNNLNNPFAILGYVLGWGIGTLLGMWVEERIAHGYRLIQVINTNREVAVADHLRDAGIRVTQMEGYGMRGPVEVAMTVIRRRELVRTRERIMEIAPDAFITVERAERPLGGATVAADLRSRRWPWVKQRVGPV